MNDLFHWGIPGMKWGIRRKMRDHMDRSVKQKYGVDLAAKRAAAQARQSEDHKTVAGLRKKKVSEMSNDELKKLTTRLQLEKQLKDLSAIDAGPGRKFVTEVLTNAGKQLASKYVASAVEKGLPELLKLVQNASSS
jgi:hypothetical protein